MSTALTNASSRAVSNYEGDPFTAQGSEGASGNIAYVKFTGATGLFEYGKDDDVLEHGTELAIDMMNAEFVWTFWWDGEVMEQFTDKLVEFPLSYDTPPDYLPEDPNGDIDLSLEEINQKRKDDPANFRDGWSVQASFNGRALDGSDQEFCIKLNAGVALNSFHTLRKAFGRQRKLNEGKLPVIIVDVSSYEPKAKSAGKKRYAPKFDIDRWITEEEMASMVGDNPEDYDDEPAPQETAKAAPADEAPAPKAEEAAEEAPKPTGRRGRRGARGANMG